MRRRAGAFLRRRVVDAALVITWLVVLFQVVQLGQVQDYSLPRKLSYQAVMLALGAAASVLWWRSRRRARTGRRTPGGRRTRAGG